MNSYGISVRGSIWGLLHSEVISGRRSVDSTAFCSSGSSQLEDAISPATTFDEMKFYNVVGVPDQRCLTNQEMDEENLGFGDDRQPFVDRFLNIPDDDNLSFLVKLRDRIDNMGMELPKIEVRYEKLSVDADVYVGSRALPSVPNFTINMFEALISCLHMFPGRKKPFSILHNVSGIVKPCRMTLLLGPPGSGKTTLLLALAGRLDSDLRVSGRVTYNGCRLDEFVPQRTSAYIGQQDLHIPEMTVRETLRFSSRCQGVGTRYEMFLELSKREKEAGIKSDPIVDAFTKAMEVEGQRTALLTDYILKNLGLDVCADTIIGNEMRRGISGGQKKRVTTGEMLVGVPTVLWMDEISNGLDSSTTYQIVKRLRQSGRLLDCTTVISLLQPAPETYELFDDIILLSEGQIVYQGARQHVLEFFESMGFVCPERKGVAEFLQEVTSRKDQQQYWAMTDRRYKYVPVNQFAAAFQLFHVGRLVADELAVPYDKQMSHPAALITSKYGVTSVQLFSACFSREWLLMKRNLSLYIFKTSQISIVALITMTLFLRTRMRRKSVDDGDIYLGALYFGIARCVLNGFAELPMTIAKLPGFYKQRDMLLYPAWAFSLPTWIIRIPISLLDSGIWVFMTYYVIGFDPQVRRLFQQLLLLFFVHQTATSLFRFMASLGRNMVTAYTCGHSALITLLILSGFIISRDNIKGWWIWGYWSSPFMYAYNAMAVNEFLSNQWRKPVFNGENSHQKLGELVLRSRGMFADERWYWIGIAALAAYTVLFNVLFTFALAFLKPLGKSRTVVSEEARRQRHLNRTGEDCTSTSESSISQCEGRGAPGTMNREAKGAAVANRMKGMALPFRPLSIAFDDINYHVDMPPGMKESGIAEDRLQLLRNVSGAFRPGVLTALVGVSGAGKTTLLDVLAGRKTGGYIEGSITINGFPKKQQTFARISGYCEQNDIHSPYVTVIESLIFSAWLRLPADVEPQRRKMFVEEVMELVELRDLRDSVVGLPNVSGLSIEQRKRLTIAVELVANPSIMFMDEPTSGLDARAAAIVMRTVRNTVDTGRTVVCTIHQPSIDIFETFDELLLMNRGGQVIYAGPLGTHSDKLIEYFESVNGVVKIKEGCNPATWMLEITAGDRLGIDFGEIYQNSSLYQRNKALIRDLSTPLPGSKDLQFPTEYSQTFFNQCKACLWKRHWSYWRNPRYSAVRFFYTIIAALVFGTIFWNLGTKRTRQQDLFNSIGAMYASALHIGINYMATVQPVVGVERTAFYRERAAGMYSALPYAFAEVAIELPYILIQAAIYTALVYWMISFEVGVSKFMWYMFFMYISLLYSTLFGMMTVALTPNNHTSSIVSVALGAVWNLFSGFIIPRPRIPVWWIWFYWTNPVAWTLNGLAVSQYGDVISEVSMADGSQKAVFRFVEEYFGYHHEYLGGVALITVGFCVAFALVSAFGIKMLNFQKR